MIITSNLKGVMIDVKPKAATKRGGEYIIMIYTTEVCSRHECHIRQLCVKAQMSYIAMIEQISYMIDWTRSN